MNDFIKYVEGVRSKTGITKITDMATLIGKTQSYMTKVLQGHQAPSDDVCIKLAKLSGDDPERIIALAHKCYAPETEKPYWEKIFKAVVTASLCMTLIFPVVFKASVPFDILCKIICDYRCAQCRQALS